MNEYMVDGQLYQVSDEDLDHFLNKYPNAILQKPDTVEAEEIVSDTVKTPVNESMESDELIQPKKEENISSELIIEDEPFKPIFSKTGNILNKPKVKKIGDDKDWEEFDWSDETGKKIKRSAISIFGAINRIPTMLNEFKYSLAKGIINHGVANVPYLFENAKKNIDNFDKLTAEEQQQSLNNIFDQLPLSLQAKEGLRKFEEAEVRAAEIETQLTQFDNTIGQAFAQGDIGEATARVISEAIGSLPFMAEAMIPYVGIPLIVGQEAARASGKAQKEGDEINLKLMGYSAVIGMSEGLLEVTTRRIGKTMFKELFNKSSKAIKKSMTQMGLQLAKDAGAEGLSESATLTINSAAEALIRGDEKAFEGYLLELVDTFLIGATSGAGPSGVGKGYSIVRDGVEARQLTKQLKESNYNNLTEAFINTKEDEGSIKLAENKYTEKFLNFDLKNKVANGEMTIEKSNEIKKNFKATQGAANRLKVLGLTGEAKIEAVELLKRKTELDGELKQLDDAAAGSEIKAEIDSINERLKEISKTNAALKRGKDVKTTEEFAKELGFELIQDTKTEDLQKIAPKGFDAKTDYGFIQGNKIYLNNDIIGETNEIKTASHELLHGILTKSILDGDLTKDSVEKFIKNSFGQKAFDLISESMEAMGYDQTYLENRPDEYLTQLYDADIMNEVGAFEKVARFVESVISKMTGGRFNPTFTSKNDLGLFLREYKQSVESGTLSKKLKGSKFFNKAQDTDITTLSKQKITPRAQEFIDLNKEGVITNEALVEIINSPSSTSVDKFGAIEAIVEANWPVISNAIKFNPTGNIPMDAVKTAITEQIQGIFPGRKVPLFKDYNENQGKVNTVISSFLRPRQAEILERAKKIGGVTQEGTSIDSKEAKQVKDTTTEKTTEKTVTKPSKAKESLRKKIKLTDATSKKIVDAVVKTFGTKLPPVDSKQFKQALQKAFRTELKTTIAKDVLGSRAAYETFLRDNFETILEALPQDVINKRFRPFAEDTGKREKTKEGKKIFKKKDITKAEFIKYFLGRDVGTSTKGTRKDALAEALAEQFATDATMETIQRPDVKEKREFLDKKQTTEKISKAIKRPKNFAFSKGKLRAFQAKDIFESSDTDFAANNEDWKKLSKIYGFDHINMKTAEGRKKLLDNVVKSGLAAKLPKIFWISFQGTTDSLIPDKTKKELNLEKGTKITSADDSSLRTYGGNLPFKSVSEAEAWIKNAENGKDVDGNDLLDDDGKIIKVKFPEATPEIKQMLKKEPYSYTEKGKSKNKLAKDLNNPKFIKEQNQSLKGLKQVFEIFQTLIQQDAQTNIPSIIALLSSTSSNQRHFIRTAAPVKFFQESFTGKKSEIREEHTLPASLVAKYLFIEATLDNVNKVWPNIKRNYFQGALSKINDDKLAGDGVNGEKYDYKEKTPPGWTMEDNIWSRYFNPNVANNDFGISPKEIMLGKGKSVYDSYPVNSAGNIISRGMVNSVMAAASKNKNLLPKKVQPLKGVTNNEVLSEMKNLDTQAQDARSALSKSKDLSKDFNEILERVTGIGKEKQYGKTKARAVGADKGKWDWAGIPPSAQDFIGLTRYFVGKGKQGDKAIAWIKENFADPFARANIDISNARVALANDYKALKKLLNLNNKTLNKKIPGEPYTVSNALRVYTWTQQGMKIPGLSQADTKILNDYVSADSNLVTFANELISINKDNGYPKPQDGWLAGTITTDLLSGLNTVVRAKYLEQWQNNVDQVFTEANMNKLEAAFGKGYRDALENMLGRMKTGSNRGFKGDTLTGRFIDWINGSVGAIMFFNMRSAVLQTISAINFVNWSDNNPIKAATAFANQPQYWKDVVDLMNSDYLVERRNGLKINVSEADIAEIASESKNKAKAFINKILKLGFLPTQIADSFAIATGGATLYRNRYKSYIKEGLSEKEAKEKAFQDFREISEENQQSSRPDRISKQQAGPMGRVILAFANTPAQYARIMQKAVSDLKNSRGDAKTNVSKIIYYGMIQNVIFNALQQALFAMAFSDEEPDEEKKNKKYIGIANGMADSLLRGAGFHGAAISAVKGALLKMADGGKAQDAAIELLDISPTVSSKIGKMRSAGRTWDWNQKEIREKGWSLDNPAWLASGQVISASTNIPLDRLIRKLDNIKDASDANNAEWMRVANALGWQKWELEWAINSTNQETQQLLSRAKPTTRSKTLTRGEPVKRN